MNTNTDRSKFVNALNEFNQTIEKFGSDNHVNYISINNIRLNAFAKPTRSLAGTFVDPISGLSDPRSGRKEYGNIIQSQWTRLKSIYNPCVYVFELVSPDYHTVFSNYTQYIDEQRKSPPPKRACSAISIVQKETNDRTILYVGKSEKPVDGRIVVHFGYYEKGVAGLQLVHWADRVPDLTINLHVFELVDPELFPYLEVFEKILFSTLKPIIGKR